RTFARLLDWVTRKLKGDPARRPDSVAHALGELEIVAGAGRQDRAGLRDADDRFSGPQLRRRQPVVEIALEVERRHARVIGIIEPELGSQLPFGFSGGICHFAAKRLVTLVICDPTDAGTP